MIMKKIIVLVIALLGVCMAQSQVKPVIAKKPSACETLAVFDTTSTPNLGIIIASGDIETAWNAVRLGVYSQQQGDLVVIFVTGKGLDAFMQKQDKFDVFNLEAMSESFWANGGKIYSCASCAKVRGTEEVQSCTITGIADLYQIVKRSKRVLTF